MTNQSRGELVPGGLALVVGATHCLENIGMVVTTESFVDGVHRGPDGIIYRGKPAWFCVADGLSVAHAIAGVKKTGFGYISAKNLLPINPEADPMDITEQMECKA